MLLIDKQISEAVDVYVSNMSNVLQMKNFCLPQLITKYRMNIHQNETQIESREMTAVIWGMEWLRMIIYISMFNLMGSDVILLIN